MNLKKIISYPWFHVIFLMLMMVILSFTSRFEGTNSYQLFIEKLAQGKIDFSLPGFHGADFFALPIYWLTHSPVSAHILDIILVIFTLPLLYLLGNQIFNNKKRGIFLVYAYLFMPLDWLDMFRGEHHAAFIFFFVLGLYLIFKKSFWSWLAIGVSYIIKPYAIFAAPFFWYKKQYKEFFLSLVIPAIYVLFQVTQTGQLMFGAHPDAPASFVFNLKNFIFNLVYVIQNIFSVHNYSPYSRVYLTDMSHVSVLLVILALIAVFNSKKYIPDKRLFMTLASSALFGLIIPVSFEYLDMWRIVIFYFMVIMLALPVLDDYKFLIPVSAGISGFQFFYAYLQYQNSYWPSSNRFLILIWVIIFIISISYYFLSSQKQSSKPDKELEFP